MKNPSLYLTQKKPRKKENPTNNNKQVEKYGATNIEVEKSRKSAKNREIALFQSQECNAYISTSNLDTEKYIKTYVSVTASK